VNEFEALQQELSDLAASPQDGALDHYRMRKPERPPGIYWQLRWLAGRAVRLLESAGIRNVDSWPANLKQASGGRKPLLLWALGADRMPLRENCSHLAGLLPALPDYSPVLVTDVADFGFFSRLGWLVEYLPDLSGPGESFQSRKAKFLLRLYGGAPVLPAVAEWQSVSETEQLQKLVAQAWTLKPGP
jgi:hypothetical protein